MEQVSVLMIVRLASKINNSHTVEYQLIKVLKKDEIKDYFKIANIAVKRSICDYTTFSFHEYNHFCCDLPRLVSSFLKALTVDIDVSLMSSWDDFIVKHSFLISDKNVHASEDI